MKGQLFQAPFIPEKYTPDTADDAPSGQWKDGLCDCTILGIFHPSCLNACCFPQILLAQVMTRMGLNFMGLPGTPEEVTNTFKYVFYIVVACFGLNMVFSGTHVENTRDLDDLEDIAPNPFVSFVGFCLTVYTVITMCRTRRAVRERYQIPADSTCGADNDFLCSFCCSCCTAAQLARQTADYRNSSATCCSETGLRRAAPVMIV